MAPVPLTPQQQRLVQQAIAREKVIVKQIQKSTPVVQSYIQDLRPDVKLYQVPVADQYMIGRVDFGKAFTATNTRRRSGAGRRTGGSRDRSASCRS